jgi:hypothetical protein
MKVTPVRVLFGGVEDGMRSDARDYEPRAMHMQVTLFRLMWA